MDRNDILTRACELYLEDGVEAVSMRRLARDLGVTAPALYRHYHSREEMLLDVVAEAYRRLSERLYGALSGRTPAERLLLAGQAYLDFALDQPKYYEMLYTPAHTLGAEAFPEQVTEQVASVGRFFNDRVRECIDAGLFQPLDPADVSGTLWAHAHGLISIYLRGCLDMDAEEFRRHYRASSRRAITGMATPAYEVEMDRAVEDLSRVEAVRGSGGKGGLRSRASSALTWLLMGWGAPVAAEGAQPGGELLLGIDEAVELALDRSRELAEARLLLTEAEEQNAEAWGEIWPRVDFSASYVRNISPPVSFVPARIFNPAAPPGEFLSLEFGADNSWQSALTVRQPLFDPRALVGLGAAGDYLRLRTEMVRGQSQQVATRVRLLCYDLLLRGEEVRLTERSLDRLRQALEETRGRARAGLASDYDVLRLEVELANLEPELLESRNARDSVRRRLGLELALDDPGRLRLSESATLTTAGSAPGLPVGDLVQTALAHRSDVRQLEQTAGLGRRQVRLEQVEYLPKISLFATWDVQAQQDGRPDFFGSARTRATSKMAGLSVELPLFTGLQRDARIDQRQAALRQVQVRARMARDQATVEVRDLEASLAEAVRRQEGQRLAVAQARRGFEIAGARYREGVGSQLEVTDAEVALRRSEFNLARAAHDRLARRARLGLAIGRVPPVDGEAAIDPEETK